MRSQLFVKSIDLHSNPSNFEIGIVIRYGDWYIVYNTVGQRISCFNKWENEIDISSFFYFTKEQIVLECMDDTIALYTSRFEFIRSERKQDDFDEKIFDPINKHKTEIYFTDFVLFHLFQESMFDYFEVLSKNKEVLNQLNLSRLFNPELFIDFLAIKNVLGLNFTTHDIPNKFVRDITHEIKQTVEKGKSKIQFESMSEYIYHYFNQYNVVKKASALKF
jgi:hypothetical protein